MNSVDRQPARRSLRSEQLAVIAKGAFDIPPGTRRVLIVAGVCGIIIAFVASLQGNRPSTIEIDKIMHFSGYFLLAFVFVMGLRPQMYIPGLIGLVLMGYVIEQIQPLTGRSKDIEDFYANTIGIAAGAVVGLIARFIYSLVRKELTTASIRRRLQTYPTGATILREGGRSNKLYIIKSGEVRLSKMVDDQPKELTTLGPGEVIGLLGCIQGTPQYSTVTALRPTAIYGLSLRELLESSGGKEHPVALVLTTFADKTRELVDHLNEIESKTDATQFH